MKNFIAPLLLLLAVTPALACNVTQSSGGPVVAKILSPQPFRVFQRNHKNVGRIAVTIQSSSPADCIEARLLRGGFFGSALTPWTTVSSGAIDAPAGGWYQMEIRAVKNGAAGAPATVDNVGVGEVFVIGGQSNASFFGRRPQQSRSNNVVFFDGQTWSQCRDPLTTVDTGKGGSPWCLLGDELERKWNVPIAFVPRRSEARRWGNGNPARRISNA